MSTTIDQQFIEFIVKALVGDPDAVTVTRRIDEKGVLLELTVAAEDLGRVIGKRGATAQSLRSLLRALGTKNDARYNLKIVDVDRLDENGQPLPRPETADRSDDDGAADEGGTDDVIVDSPAEAPASAIPADGSSDLAKKTRKELADLDDLDI